ncbi:MAG: DUF5677 domain-containing protein [Pseudomonadota bacterium]
MNRIDNSTDWLEFIENLIEKEAIRLIDEKSNEEEATRAIERGVDEVLKIAPGIYVEAMKKNAQSMLRKERRMRRAFEKRSFKRWRPAFDLLETIWRAAEESTAAFNNKHRHDAAEKNDQVFDALTRLNGRGLQVASEAIHLLRGGYADGAMSRWRTLHEILVTAMFIRNHGPDVAERYFASVDFSRLKAANQINRFADRANLQPFSSEELLQFEKRCEAWEERFGEKLNDHDWARPGFPGLVSKARITFAHLEENTGMDHWRPRYKWASQHTHAGHRDHGVGLGLTETDSDIILVGASNSGFVDPMQMISLHVCSLATILLLTRPSIDTLTITRALYELAHEVGETAIEREAETLRKHRRHFWSWRRRS